MKRIVSATFLFMLLVLSTHLSQAQMSMNGPPDTPWYYMQGVSETLHRALNEAALKGYISGNDFETLDFNSGDIEHGFNPKYKNVSSAKPFYISGTKVDGSFKAHLQSIRTSQKRDAFMNLRRFTEPGPNGLTRDNLYFVIPDVSESFCFAHYVQKLDLQVPPDNHSVVEDRVIGNYGENFKIIHPPTAGCVQVNDGTIYMFYYIIGRNKKHDGTGWEIPHY